MSGDVQPRKRKDKKRRKDEAEQIPTQTHTPLTTNSANDDLNIHIHKEGGTGGGICAKLVFFVLLSAIAVLIGMIITEYRGQTDVDTVDTESRFSQIFEGWTDTSHDHHDDHDIEDLDDHDLEHDEEDIENVSDAEEEEEEEHEPSEEEDDEEEIHDDNEESEEGNDDTEEDEGEDEEQDDQTLEDSEENQIDQDEDDDEIQESDEEERETYEESDEKADSEADDDDEQEHDDDEQELQNIDSEENENDDNDELAGEEDEVSSEKHSKQQDDDSDEDTVGDDAVDEEEADEKDDKVLVTSKKIKTRAVVDDETPPDEKQQESSGMAVKLGVGVALLVVAHLVLVRKWRTAPDDKPIKEEPKEATPDLSRRNTIVVPPTYQEVEQDIEQDEEDYSDEELSEEEESREEPKSAKTKYQELRSTYTRSLTPEGEIDYHKPSDEDEYEENIDEEEDEEVSEEEEEEGEEEGESDNEDYDDDEDEELLKRLEAKYGKLHGNKSKGATTQDDIDDSDSDKQSDDAAGYEYSNITNKEDLKIKDEIDKAQKTIQNNSAYAIKLFDKILQNYPSSPRSIYGKALALDYLADQKRSNPILEQALKFYTQLFNTENVPHALFEMAAERCINRMRFVGQYRNVINVHNQLIKKFPNNPKHANDLAVTYLTINRVEAARSVLNDVLHKWPNNGFALVHLGFILKTTDNKLQEAVEYLRRGLDTKDKGVVDGRFYFHLGDALTRLGQNKEAMEVYEEGVKNDVFLSKYQRSLYNVPRLTGKPWWKLEDLPYMDLYRLLKQNWQTIKEEGLTVLNKKGYFQDESENLRDSGEWKQFELFARGQKNIQNCKKCPFTCSIIEKIPEARGCKRGQTKFSVIHPGTHVWPHCGPTNCRLRTHLGLKVPAKTFIRVAEEIRSWKEGEIFVFDDSFEHEVWHNGTDFRLVLIIDVWHPELTPVEKRNLSPI